MDCKNLLLELGTEELPPKSLRKLAESLHDSFVSLLQKEGLGFKSSRWFATPRRLALYIESLEEKQPDQEVTIKGPSQKAAFDANNQPTPAAQGWARANNIDLKDTKLLDTGKGLWLSYTTKKQGKTVFELVPGYFEKALKALPIPKLMHWGNKRIEFVRPVHTVTMMYGSDLIPGTILGVESSATVMGHRFTGERTFTISSADAYQQEMLSKGNVVVDYEQRKATITEKIKSLAESVHGQADLDDDLLEEVTSIVEDPHVYLANFDEKFLSVPAEALVHTMKGDQKYFPIYDSKHNLLPTFAFVSNINPENTHWLVFGNERVIRPRLSDAEFFFKTDRHHRLEDFHDHLQTVVYQKDLGTVAERSEWVRAISRHIASLIGADEHKVDRAAYLAKCDLSTTMVKEFTDTQGIMGMHYARMDGEDPEVAEAIFHQYLPRYAGDSVPTGPVQISVSLAEKLCTIVGMIGINQMPKGDKDPFGLRRAAIGMIRIMLENNLDLDLPGVTAMAVGILGSKVKNPDTSAQVSDYIFTRLKSYYQDQGITSDIFQAVYAVKPSSVVDFDKRVKAVVSFQEQPEAKDLSAAFKRINNILSQAKSDQGQVQETLLTAPEEILLFQEVNKKENLVISLQKKKDYNAVLLEAAQLKDTIDTFFEHVMVNDQNSAVRNNRISLLAKLRSLFNTTADISVLN
ncbi:MAG: glycine--tRNA ligase subunit beta [Succinivibrionaceae bacterium]|nr:glycine--tRNA ligase subunit beta [Succinivibrionaceae bacterium]